MQFSKVEYVIKPFKLSSVEHALIDFGISGMTVSEVFGAVATQPGEEQFMQQGMAPMLRVEVVMVRDQVAEVIEVLRNLADQSARGDERISVIPIEKIHRIRTGEEGIDAL